MHRTPLAIAAVLVLGLGPSAWAEVPAGAKGFAGMVTGKVVSKGEDKVTVEVTAIAKTWKHSTAENAQALVGKTVEIRIIPGAYERKKGDYLAKVRKFFSLLGVGDSESFDVRHVEGDWLKFLELTKDQLERVERAR